MVQASYRAVLRDWWLHATRAHRPGSRHARRRFAALLRRTNRAACVSREASFVKRIASLGKTNSSLILHRSSFSPHASRLVFECLEPRLLLSAGPVPEVASLEPSLSPQHSALSTSDVSVLSPESSVLSVQDSALSTSSNISRLSDLYGSLPLSFELNQGQTDSDVKFLSRGPGYALFLTSDEAVLSLSQARGQGQGAIGDLSALSTFRTSCTPHRAGWREP